jgi:acetaldehyde dehydrogenase (acetylating)
LELRDRDLISIQEARELAAVALIAQQKFARFSQEKVDAIVEAVAKAAAAEAETLARAAVEETGYGNVPDKILKNRMGAVDVPNAIRRMRTVGIINENKEKKILEVAVPVGVICAIIPVTNPTSTAIYKTLIALKARNAIVLSPHPGAVRCICQTAKLLARAAVAAGAPDGIVTCMERNTLAGTQELMRAPEVGLILATGGTGLVRAAYSSGKPAYGVGPGNVPAFIEHTANVQKAVADIFAGKTFDYGTLCSSEQAIVVEEAVRDAALEECRKQGGYFLNDDEARAIAELIFPGGSHAPSSKVVGRPATHVAELAGIKVPPETRVLIARLSGVGRGVRLSGEKLCPVLGFYSVTNLAAGIDLCTQLLRFGGMGHTASIHSQNDAAIREYGLAVPAFRVCVNTASTQGSVGYSTNLFPAMTLGCGALGCNITSDNIGPQHLMNLRRVAWESRAVEHRSVPAADRMNAPTSAKVAAASESPKGVIVKPTNPAPQSQPSNTSGIPDRAAIAHAVEHVMAHLGIARGAAASSTAKTLAVSAGSASPATKTFANATNVSPFVTEGDVRRAVTRGEKIFIGPKTILTPSARDVAGSENVLVLTDYIPPARAASSSE